MGADRPHQALGQGAQQGGGDEKGLQPQVHQADDGGHRVVGMQGGKDQVAGQGGLDRIGGGLQVADLADHDDIRVLAQDIAQDGGEGHVDLGCTAIWLNSSCTISTGSSTVMMFFSGVAIFFRVE